MTLITVIFIVVISIILIICSVVVTVKIFGTGIFYGLDLNLTYVMGKNDDTEEALSRIVAALDTECMSSDTKIFIIDGGMSIGQRELCRKYCENYRFIEITTPDNLCEKLFMLKKDKALLNKG